jgi:uncharacterized protein
VSVAVVRFATLPSTPWKNGLGTTRQLAIHPFGSDANAFEWRISIAALRGAAPFSSFAGVERCLAMLEGELTLVRPAQPDITLTPASPPLTFSGSESITGRVETSDALDLNLMYRPSRWSASLRKVALRDCAPLAGDVTMLCALDPMRVAIQGVEMSLDRFDLLRTTDSAIVALTDATAYAIELRER